MRPGKISLRYLIPVFYFTAISLMVIYQWSWQSSIRNGSDSPIYRNLMENSAFIRHGFDKNQLLKIPEIDEINTEGGGWVGFKSFPLTIRNSLLPDLPKRTFFSPFGKPAQEFTIIIPIEIDVNAMAQLKDNSSGIPGLYFSIIGENWEIYLNGNLVSSQIFINEKGQIKNNRTWRDVRFPIDRNLFVSGTNVLAIRIIGDPSYSVTGLYYAEPYYMDEFNTIEKKHQSYLRYFICGVMGYTGIYYLLIYISIRNKREIYNLYYSIFSLILCIHFITTDGSVNNIIPNYNIAVRFEYISLYFSLAMLCIFIEQIGRQKVSKISWGFLGFCVYISITQIFFCNQYGDEVLHIFLMIILVYFTYIFFSIVHQYFKNRNLEKKAYNYGERRFSGTFLSIIVGSLVVYACGIHDALDVIIFHNAFRLFLYSTFVFQVGMTLTMSRRFSKVYKRLEHSNVILEKTVHDRTLELEKQTEIAIRASQAKSQFLAKMSHEIRTPLNAVIGLSRIELQGDISQKSKENINQIYQSGSSLLEIINEILDISKIEAGNFKLIQDEYDTAGLISDTVNLNRVRIGSKPINFILEIESDLPAKLIGDELKIKQILNNILSNAIKYTKAGSITLAIKCEINNNKKDKTTLLCFIVSDTGIGIRADDKDKLFTDYTQLDTRINRNVEGTGLGLAITKKLAEMMNGNISVESEYGKGSKFTVNIIQTITDGEETIGNETAIKLRNFQYIKPGKEREIDRSWMPYGKILVVDDMPVNLQVARGFLEPYGLHVDTADSGQEAINKIMLGRKYDLIFMDHMMPDMDGIETTVLIRSKNIKIPVIALTANALVGSMEMFVSNGFNGFISKPIDINQLDNTLNEWVRDKQSKETLQKAEEEKRAKRMVNLPDYEEDEILEIPGVNTEHGIASTGGTAAGYRKVLSTFSRDTQERLVFFNNCLNREMDEKKISLFTVYAHSLKSALSFIGVQNLSDKAMALETAGKERDIDFIYENLHDFIEKLSKLIENILEFSNTKPENEEENLEISSESIILLQELVDLIKTKAAFSKIDSIIEELNKTPINSRLREVLDQVSDEVLMAEYDNALQIIKKIV